jgi:hypothetical protein
MMNCAEVRTDVLRTEVNTSQQYGTSEMERCEFASLRGAVWRFARSKKGAVIIQKAFRDARSDETKAALAHELRTHVWEALKDPHANHVLQACIETTQPKDSQFIVDELLQRGRGAAVLAARHEYGCRIVQRLLERFIPDSLHNLIQDLIGGVVTLCTDFYGSYVVLTLLEKGNETHKRKLMEILVGNVSLVGSTTCGVSVLRSGLYDTIAKQDREALADALVKVPSMLLSMSNYRHGEAAARLALQTAPPQQRQKTAAWLLERKKTLKQHRYGRKLLGFVERLLGQH